MLKHILVLFFSHVVLSTSVHAQTAANTLDLKKLFNQQVAKSAQRGFIYAKNVRADEPDGSGVVQKYDVRFDTKPVMKLKGKDATTQSQSFEDELAYAVEYVAQDPNIASYYKTEQVGDTLNEIVKPGFKEKCDLNQQRVVISEGVLRYIMCNIVRTTLLFNTYITARVYFDSKGFYEKHELLFSTEIAIIGTTSGAQITGSAQY